MKLKRPKLDKKTNKLITHKTWYLTANLFMGGHTHYHVEQDIKDFCKQFLIFYLQGLPKLIKARMHLTYSHPQDTFDLDNKGFFWRKIIMDILKTPSTRQMYNAKNRGKRIVSTHTLPDDTVRYVDEYVERYVKGPHQIIIELYGIKMEEQKKMII